MSVSSAAAFIQILTDWGSSRAALAMIRLAFSGMLSSAAWSQTSSLFGHISHPFAMIFRAATIFLACTSSAAAAIHPGACFGLVLMTESSKARARLMSPIWASDWTTIELRSVK